METKLRQRLANLRLWLCLELNPNPLADNFRKAVLNALVWICKLDVPADGVVSKVSDEEIKAILDPKGKK